MPAFAGIVLSVAGILMMRHLTGIFLLAAGALLATATDETSIDVPRQRIRSGTRLLGMFTLGKWQAVSEFSGITLIPMCRKYSVRSMSNKEQTVGDCRFSDLYPRQAEEACICLKKMPDEG